jgi:hypothetical protein
MQNEFNFSPLYEAGEEFENVGLQSVVVQANISLGIFLDNIPI